MIHKCIGDSVLLYQYRYSVNGEHGRLSIYKGGDRDPLAVPKFTHRSTSGEVTTLSRWSDGFEPHTVCQIYSYRLVVRPAALQVVNPGSNPGGSTKIYCGPACTKGAIDACTVDGGVRFRSGPPQNAVMGSILLNS